MISRSTLACLFDSSNPACKFTILLDCMELHQHNVSNFYFHIIRFASKIKSGTLTETKPIHLDLFEEMKTVIKSDETVSELAEEPKEENEQPPEAIEEESAQVVQVQTQSSWNLSSMFLGLPKPVQILAFGVSSFVVMRLLFSRSDPSIAQLSRQVEDLESDVREIKAMLKTILEAVEDNRSSKNA